MWQPSELNELLIVSVRLMSADLLLTAHKSSVVYKKTLLGLDGPQAWDKGQTFWANFKAELTTLFSNLDKGSCSLKNTF